MIRRVFRVVRHALSYLGWCDHPHRYRTRDLDGGLWLVCDTCSHRVEAFRPNAAERAERRLKIVRPPP